ncbi:hypothetical protein AA0N74_08010 [Chromobacterium vaccinii]|uniref:hypothetical protein n=1 Tax=Chromobacterium vaccinii TaxID=1108595 RepID=UPI0031DE9CB3
MDHMIQCDSCKGSGYSPEAEEMDHQLVGKTFDAMERHQKVKEFFEARGTDFRCPKCKGEGSVSVRLDLVNHMLQHRIARGNLHNVTMLGTKTGDDGSSVLNIEYQGQQYELPGLKFYEKSAGMVGFVGWFQDEIFFRPYLDQTLRRVPEFDRAGVESRDADGRKVATVGWICAAKPEGFRAPVGLVPGKDGQYVPDLSVEVRFRVPQEFLQECTRRQLTPEEVLSGFVGDVSGIMNWADCPRADDYSSNGSDEREFAERWLQRAYFLDEDELDEREKLEEAAIAQEDQRNEFVDLFDDFQYHGGKADELITAVRALVEKQAADEEGKL